MEDLHTPERRHIRRPDPWGLCGPFMTQLPISGAVLTVVDRGGHRSTVSATDPVAQRWDELEFELGSGPMVDCTAELAPQLLADVRTSLMNSVVGFHLDQLGVRAVFAFPLVMGTATVGAVGLYRTTPGALSADRLGVALSLARSATMPAVREALRLAALDGDSDGTDAGPGLRREVHQATGMISTQLDSSTTDAFARLRAYSISSGRSVTAVSRDVVAGKIDFLDLD